MIHDRPSWRMLLILGLSLVLCCTRIDAAYQYETKTLDVPIDHFTYTSNATFKLRYLLNETYAKGSTDGPILLYAGNEGDIELFAQNTGFMWEIAPMLNATLLFAEHRYYGQSLPFGNRSYESPATLGYLTSEQALADYAYLLTALNPPSNNTIKQARPVIVLGGSYGGMLAAWFRIKYPHLVVGAIAASAPIRQFQDLTPCGIFNQILTSVFRTAGQPACVDNIRASWQLLTNYSATADGLRVLNEKFKFCTNLTKATDVTETLFSYLTDVYGNLAMINYPYESNFLAPVPAYPVREFCHPFDKNYTGTDLLDKLQQALSVYTNYTGKATCLSLNASAALGDRGWDFQACTEMVMPMCADGVNDMFWPQKWNLDQYSDTCFKQFGIRPHPQNAIINYGGQYLVGSITNIVFSNGLLDPWSGGGVLRSSNDKIKIVLIPEGAHHIDLRAANANDPETVVLARQKHYQSMLEWIAEYRRLKHY
ncbi:lysosomal Pro-X carboxypeptidase-like [Anopheles albimanus]|uniref:Lysosomal Pro-X carboxypeptidase n=1 Tax=Anopheles albimanus TaxID=7167 RepID=A0A182F9Y6_ANOAL|nr:lysosomal Pro-X carboxypeptidase-like [Anopheles albimanus]XP_035786105.1 lysosomal Pro-X carboxypeptidase-like [Anopheles albimanus]